MPLFDSDCCPFTKGITCQLHPGRASMIKDYELKVSWRLNHYLTIKSHGL